MKKVNTLIVGQGLAGSVFSFMLHREGISFRVIDAGQDQSASRVAAGMYTPITGKRKTIHPLTVEQIPFALSLYREVESLLGCTLLHELPVHQLFSSAEERAAVEIKTGATNYTDYVSECAGGTAIEQEHGCVKINSSGWVDCKGFVEHWRQWLKNRGILQEGTFDYENLDPLLQPSQYKEVEFENIVFCEGFKAMDNPFFAKDTIVPCKGEVLTVRVPNLLSDRIWKKSGIYLVPLGGETYKAGATYQWGSASPEPELAGRIEIEAVLKTLIGNNYEVLKHESGIRPTTKNREVFADQHPVFKNMFRLNGLGTKGVLNAPWWANKLLESYFK